MCKMGMGGISVAFVVLCLALKHVEGVGEYPTPPICATLECISYQVVHTQKEFEIRSYPISTWIASPNLTTITYALGRSSGFTTSYRYFRGENKERISWDEEKRTQPVLTDVIPETSFDATYRVYLRVPKDYQNKRLPHPYSSFNIELLKLPMKKLAAVKRFEEGTPTNKMIAAQLAALKNSLKDTEWKSAAAQSYCTVADYASTNEIIIWFD